MSRMTQSGRNRTNWKPGAAAMSSLVRHLRLVAKRLNLASSCKNQTFEHLPDYWGVETTLAVGDCAQHHRNRTASVLPWYDAKTRNPSKLLRSVWNDK